MLAVLLHLVGGRTAVGGELEGWRGQKRRVQRRISRGAETELQPLKYVELIVKVENADQDVQAIVEEFMFVPRLELEL